MEFFRQVHSRTIFSRRVSKIASKIAGLLPNNGTLLDVGCGDGTICQLISESLPNITVHGVDVFVRESTNVFVEHFDGKSIPYPDDHFSSVIIVDVVHHADNGKALLAEVFRVAKEEVVIKDHMVEGILAKPTLRIMDWVGNKPYGVRLPYNYWAKEEWWDATNYLDWEQTAFDKDLALYPWPFSVLFDRSLHFVARFSRRATVGS